MNKEDAKQLGEDALEELAQQLAAGKSEQLKQFLNTMSSFHNYSFGNCMLTARQKPEATMVAGFRAWQKLKRQVRKGEKGICILAPMVGKKEADDGSSEKAVFGFRAVHVFDVSQTDGQPLPDIHEIEGDPGEQLQKLHLVAMSLGIGLTYEDDLSGAFGVLKGGSIVLLSGLTAGRRVQYAGSRAGARTLAPGRGPQNALQGD